MEYLVLCAGLLLFAVHVTSTATGELPVLLPQNPLSRTLPSSPEAESSDVTSGESRPWGQHPAKYCGDVPGEEQLFKIEELIVEPNPPVPDRRFFVYVWGTVVDLPGLNDAVLTLRMSIDGDEERLYSDKLTNRAPLIQRYQYDYKKGLLPGSNELVADFILHSMLLKTREYNITAEAHLPDGRVLFCLNTVQHWEGEN